MPHFHPCNTVPLFPFLAISTPAFLTVPLFHVSHFQSILLARTSLKVKVDFGGLRAVYVPKNNFDRELIILTQKMIKDWHFWFFHN